MVCRVVESRYSLLYVHGWDKELNEATGGRTVGTYPTLAGALEARAIYQGGAAFLQWGPGYLVIAHRTHNHRNGRPLLVPPELRALAVCDCAAEDDEPAEVVAVA